MSKQGDRRRTGMKMSGFRFALGVSVCLLTVWVPATSMAGNVSASAYQMSQGEDEAWTFYRTGQYGKALAAFRGAGDERGCCRLVWTGCDGDEWSRYAP